MKKQRRCGEAAGEEAATDEEAASCRRTDSGARSPVRSHGGGLLTKNRLRWCLWREKRPEKREGGGSGEIGRRSITAATLAREMSLSTSFLRISLFRI
jgi:hypothetical protein